MKLIQLAAVALIGGLFGVLAGAAAPAPTAISALPSASALGGTEVAPVVQDSQTRKATVDQIVEYAATQITASDIGAAGGSDNTFLGNQQIDANEPRYLWNELDQGSNEKLWDLDIQSKTFAVRTRTDADGAGRNGWTPIAASS